MEKDELKEEMKEDPKETLQEGKGPKEVYTFKRTKEMNTQKVLGDDPLTPASRILNYLKELKIKEGEDKELTKEIDWTIKTLLQAKLDSGYELTEWKVGQLGDIKEDDHAAMEWITQYSRANEIRRGSADILRHNSISPPNKKAISESNTLTPPPPPERKASVQVEDIIKILKENENLLTDLRSPNFNIFEFSEIIGRATTLPALAYKIFDDLGLLIYTEEDKFMNFMKEIQKGYMNNPYHNDLHACEVLLVTNIFLTSGKFIEILELDKLDIFSVLLAAIIHDFRHPGVSNVYLQSTRSPIALTYNDKSILENYHIAECYKLIHSEEKYNILSKFTPADYRLIRKRIISLVLSTDMSAHHSQISGLKALIETNKISGWINNSLILDKETEISLFESKQMILNCILHAADLSGAVRCPKVCLELGIRVFEELFNQGDREKDLGLEMSFMCDRATSDVPTSQIGFYGGCVLPFYEALVKLSPALFILTDNIYMNINEWKKIKSEIGKKLPERIYPHI